MLSEISQPEKDKYHMISLMWGSSWTKWTKNQNRGRFIDGEQADSSGEVGEGVEGLSKKGKKETWTAM